MGNRINLTSKLSDNLIKRNLDKGEFGVEKENLRIDYNGFLSHTKHPFEEQSNITRDFCENQIELITDVFNNVDDVLSQLQDLQTMVLQTLQQLETGKELLWPFSNPPYVKGEADIPIAQFEGEQQEKTQYRNYLAEKYGKRKMLFSGIHLNYSLADEMLREGYQAYILEGAAVSPQEEFPTYQLYKSDFYLQLARKVIKYSWLIVYLTAASPILDASILECGEKRNNDFVQIEQKKKDDYAKLKHEIWEKDALTRYASVRCGELGYWNDFIPILHYENLESYIQSIEAYVHSGQLQSVSELYYPVRVKPRGENSLEHLRENGISHIELRMLDVNPLSPIGLIKGDVEFIHYLMLYLLKQENVELTEEEQILAITNVKQAAVFDDSKIYIRESGGNDKQIRKAALEILQEMESFYTALGTHKVLENIRYQKDKLLLLDNRYADRIRKEYGEDYVKRGVSLADEYAEELLAIQYVNELPAKRCI